MKNLILALLVISAISCKEELPKSPPATRQSQAATDTTAAPVAPATTTDLVFEVGQQSTLLDRVTIAKSDGAEAAMFPPGVPFIVTVRAKEVPKGLVARITILDSKGEKVREEQKPIPEATKTVKFDSGGTESWAKGDYTLEVYLGGNLVESRTLTLH